MSAELCKIVNCHHPVFNIPGRLTNNEQKDFTKPSNFIFERNGKVAVQKAASDFRAFREIPSTILGNSSYQKAEVVGRGSLRV